MLDQRDLAGSVVVGVDGSDHALAAVEWAAARAHQQNRPLRLLSSQDALPGPAFGVPWDATLDDVLRQAAEAILQQGIARARSGRPDLDVSGQLTWAPPAQALLDAAEVAELLVVGRRGRGGWSGLLLGSVSVALAGHAMCPVVVVPTPPDEAGAPTASGPVVVGVDDSHHCDAAIDFAFAEADAIGADLVAVHAWTLDPVRDAAVMADPGALRAIEAHHDELLDRMTAAGSAAHPTVVVRHRAVRDRPALALGATQGARMVVVGSRGRGGFVGLILGSTSHQLLHLATCPVAVVRGR